MLTHSQNNDPTGHAPPRWKPHPLRPMQFDPPPVPLAETDDSEFLRPADVLAAELQHARAVNQLAEQSRFELAAEVARLNAEINELYQFLQHPTPQNEK